GRGPDPGGCRGGRGRCHRHRRLGSPARVRARRSVPGRCRGGPRGGADRAGRGGAGVRRAGDGTPRARRVRGPDRTGRGGRAGRSAEQSTLCIVGGAATVSVADEGSGTLAQRIGVLRQDGMMVYYASLPISRISFLAAMVFSRLLLILPGLITPMITAKLMYDTDFVISPALLIVLPLSCMALSAIGLAIGTLVRSMDLLLVIVNLMIFVLLLVAPVLIPIE